MFFPFFFGLTFTKRSHFIIYIFQSVTELLRWIVLSVLLTGDLVLRKKSFSNHTLSIAESGSY